MQGMWETGFSRAGLDIHECANEPVRPEDDELDELSDLGEEEMREVKVKQASMKPSIHDIEEHYLSGHAVFRSWCDHCVNGQASNDPHKTNKEKEECTVPVVGMDYMYMEEEDSKNSMPILLTRDRWFKVYFADVLPRKGRDAYSCKRAAQNMRLLGAQEIHTENGSGTSNKGIERTSEKHTSR